MKSPRIVVCVSLVLAACGDDSPPDVASTTSGSASTSSSSGAVDSASSSSGPTTAGTSDGSTDTGASTTSGPQSGLELLVCSFSADSVSRFDLDDGSFLGHLGPSDDLDGALGIVQGPDDAIYVASEESNMVLRFDGEGGGFLDRFVWDDPATPEDEAGGLNGPGAVLFGGDGNLYVSSFDSDAILRFDGSGAFVDTFVPSGEGGLDGPDAGMVFGPDGDLYVPGYYSNTVARFDGMTGAYVEDFTPSDMLDAPRTLVFHGDHLYVANEGSDDILRFDASTGELVDAFVPAGTGGLSAPAGMVFGPDGVLHVASVTSDTVLRFDETGAPLETIVDAAAAGLAAPTHIVIVPALDGAG